MLVTASQEAGVLEEDEEQMLHRVFGFGDLTAGQVMVPRTEMSRAPRRRDAPGGHRRGGARAAPVAAGLPGAASTTSWAFCTSRTSFPALVPAGRRVPRPRLRAGGADRAGDA